MDEIYQEFIIELYKNPQNSGTIPDADYAAKVENTSCGDRLQIFLKVENGIVRDARFVGHGCAISIASASLFTGYLKGKKLDDLFSIGSDRVLSLLKIDLSENPTRMKCALLPLDAMKKALKIRDR